MERARPRVGPGPHVRRALAAAAAAERSKRGERALGAGRRTTASSRIRRFSAHRRNNHAASSVLTVLARGVAAGAWPAEDAVRRAGRSPGARGPAPPAKRRRGGGGDGGATRGAEKRVHAGKSVHPRNSAPNAAVWSAHMSVCARAGRAREALDALALMRACGVALDAYTLASALTACRGPPRGDTRGGGAAAATTPSPRISLDLGGRSYRMPPKLRTPPAFPRRFRRAPPPPPRRWRRWRRSKPRRRPSRGQSRCAARPSRCTRRRAHRPRVRSVRVHAEVPARCGRGGPEETNAAATPNRATPNRATPNRRRRADGAESSVPGSARFKTRFPTTPRLRRTRSYNTLISACASSDAPARAERTVTWWPPACPGRGARTWG